MTKLPIGKELKLVVCSKCMNVKAIIANCFGTHSFCPICEKERKHYTMKASLYGNAGYVKKKESITQ